MTRARKWLLGAGVVIALLLTIGMVAVSRIPSNVALAQRLAGKLEGALDANVTIGELRWQVMPSPVVVLKNAVITPHPGRGRSAHPRPIVFDSLTIHPDLAALWRAQLKASDVELDGASIPQLSLRGLGQGGSTSADDAPGSGQSSRFTLAETPLARLSFHNVTWISRSGIPVIYEGGVDFDSRWRPRTAQFLRPDVLPVTDLTLARQGEEDRWTVKVRVGGGRADGEVRLQPRAGGRMHLSGELKPRDIEVSSALEAFNRRPVLAGKATGETTLSAEGSTVSELAQSLHTKTTFVVGAAKLLRFDLDKAIKTLGKQHDGQTPLKAITAQLDTQSTPDGIRIMFSNIKATSGAFSATGKATLFNRQIEAEFAVDVVDGLIGVPLKISGQTNQIKVSVPGGAVAGAVIGTAVLPGVGTVLGARLGAAIGKLFSPAPARAPVVKPGAAGGSKPP